ncbi:AP-4 complex subunit epsilon [Gigaspora margarita]|uniref:AP-4 complex subunit epsilon n=1 Tax=Gigaspora margarita TaxID=4874 RepID=A0A8H4AZQ7_GIGMA|nr:AP-4 complex subunit epsilon [Gigaspora margarita]
MNSRLPTILNTTYLTSGLSRGFFEFVTRVGEARSKQEEDRYVSQEIVSLKTKLNHPDISSRKIRDYITRLIYCEMLGYNVEFGHIHAVKLAQSAKGLWDKRIGYLACSLFLHETHELSIMLINTLQKDLKSSNYLEVCAALTALCHLLNKDMIPAVFGLVEEALSHPKDIVRKKAVMVFSRLFHDAPDTMIHLDEKFRQMLTERDPSVLGSILCLFLEFIKADPNKFKDLVPSLISILEQVLDRWLPRSYDYHGVPAPWIQIKIIENMGLLARDDEKISSEVGPLIVHTLRKAENGVDAAYAIIFECIRAISRLHPQTLSTIIHKSPNLNPLNVITRFLKSNNHNLKYLGLTCLSEIDPMWWIEGEWWGEEQMNIIVDCLEERDDTLKRKTLDLLYAMVNSQNVVVVMEHMINALRTISTTDEFSRLLLVNRIVEISGKYPLNLQNKDYDKAVDSTFLIISKSIESKEKSEEIRQYAVSEAIKILESDINNTTKNLTSWALRILGEFVKSTELQEKIYNRLCDLLTQVDYEIQAQVITTLLKCVSKMKYCPDNIIECVAKCCQSSSGDVKQRSREFIILSKDFVLLDKIIKPYENFDDFTIDESLSFLDNFVENALKNGAKPYNRIPITREDTNAATEIRYEAYEKPNMTYFPKQIMTSLPTYDDSRLSESDRDVLLPNDRSNQSSRGVGPPVTPGQLAWFGVTQEHLPPENVHEHTSLLADSQEPNYNDYEEIDSNRQSVISLIPKMKLQPSTQSWSRAGYKPVNSTESDKFIKYNTSNTRSSLRSSDKVLSIASVTSKTTMTPEKEKLASALFSGVGTSDPGQ